ncbi:MAG: alkaline phosphatase family protein [Chlorobi bacterium]|nr:alkaline phosphatase family protein [Chlorobiota bacterium]
MNTKTTFYTLLIIGFLLIGSINCTRRADNNNNNPYLLILSMDGFRWDYPEHAETPVLDSIEKIGVKANIIPSFPTKTFPNHYTLATGLFPDNHGIILNNFYNYKLDKKYSLGNNATVVNPDFYGGEPIWVTAEKQGVISASYFWVGSEAPIKGILPTYSKPYDHYFPFSSIIDSVINWLQLPEIKRPHLIAFYFNEPDLTGHEYGPNSSEIVRKTEFLDSLLGVFFAKKNQLDIANKLNIIITSDHGMGEISKEKTVYFDNYISRNWLENSYGGCPVFLLKAKKEFYDSVYNHLKNVKHISIWKPEEIPSNLHFGHNENIQDFVVSADSLWNIDWKNHHSDKGTHGYDNKDTDMQAIFYAIGPDFKKNYKNKPFPNVDLYSLICNILNLKPAPNDGNFDDVKNMVVK